VILQSIRVCLHGSCRHLPIPRFLVISYMLKPQRSMWYKYNGSWRHNTTLYKLWLIDLFPYLYFLACAYACMKYQEYFGGKKGLGEKVRFLSCLSKSTEQNSPKFWYVINIINNQLKTACLPLNHSRSNHRCVQTYNKFTQQLHQTKMVQQKLTIKQLHDVVKKVLIILKPL